MVSEFVEDAGGLVEVESTPGAGAAFTVMSGYAPESEGPLGGAELVRKPFTAADLLTMVRSTLDLRPTEQHAAVVPS